MLEFTGTLHRIDQIVNHESPRGGIYPERTFVVKYADPDGREQLVKFIIEPPGNMNMIEDFEIGDQLKIKFYFQGKESPSKYGNGTNLYEKKRVTSIENANKEKSPKQNKTIARIPVDGYVGPDLTQDFSMFSDTLEF